MKHLRRQHRLPPPVLHLWQPPQAHPRRATTARARSVMPRHPQRRRPRCLQMRPQQAPTRQAHPQGRLPTCPGRVRVRAVTTRSRPRVQAHPVRAATTPSRRPVPVRLVVHAQVPQQPVPPARVRVAQAHVLEPRPAQVAPLRVDVREDSHHAQQAQAELPVHDRALVEARQVAALPHQVAVQQPVAAVAVEAQQVPSVVRAQGRRGDGSPSGPSGPSTSSSRRHPLAACRYLAATATRRCACVAVRR